MNNTIHNDTGNKMFVNNFRNGTKQQSSKSIV